MEAGRPGAHREHLRTVGSDEDVVLVLCAPEACHRDSAFDRQAHALLDDAFALWPDPRRLKREPEAMTPEAAHQMSRNAASASVR